MAWSSSASLVCQDVNFTNCDFSGFIRASNTDAEINGIIFSECYFDTLYQGVYLGGVSPVNGGATGVRILNSVFDNIYAEGIVFDNVGLNATGYNMFYDVGNHFAGVTYPATPVIRINADQNISVGDMFQRTTAFSQTYPRIDIGQTASIAFTGGYKVQMGTFTRFSGVRTTLTNNTSSPAAVFTVDAGDVRAFTIDYTITRDTKTKAGTITVVASTDGTGGDLSFNDVGYSNSDPGVTISASETGGTVTVSYVTTNTGIDAEFYYSITQLT